MQGQRAIENKLRQDTEPARSLFFYSFVVVLLFAPLYKAGNRPLPLMVVELAAIGFLFVIFVLHRARPEMPRALAAALAILLVYPLVQMLPLPDALWRLLPGHGEYAEEIDRFAAGVIAQGTVSVSRTLTVVPAATERGWLALLPPLACLLVVLRIPRDAVTRLLFIMAVFAGMEGLLGLLQVGAIGGSIVYRPVDEYGYTYGTAFGTFVDPNHLAGMLSMMLPVVIGLVAYSVRRARHQQDSHAANLLSQRALLFASAVMILLCLVLTWSRAGIATALVGLGCSAILLSRMRGGVIQSKFLVLGIVGVTAVLALVIGITPLMEKLAPEHLAGGAGGRLLMTVQTLRAAVAFLPFGSGLSTLEYVFPRFQTWPLGGGIDYAHNDYAQAFMELGLAAPIVVALLLAAYGMRMVELLRSVGGRSFTILQLAAGIGLLPMILHSAFEFGLHMPAIAMWFATLTGVLFHTSCGPQEQSRAKPAT
jgi:hypothetical protein